MSPHQPAPLSTVIIEDEPLARLHLRELIGATPALRLVGEAADGPRGLALVESLRPDLLFLDIRIPELDGLALLEQCTHQPLVVFTTAYDVHAVHAFELGAADYLLKPFGADRFARAVTRVQQRRSDRVAEATPSDAPSVPLAPRLRELLGPRATEAGALQHLYIRDRGAVRPVPIRDVERLEADDDYVTVYAKGARHLLTITLSELLERLDARRFVRIHRSHAVNIDWVANFAPHDAGRWAVVMRDGTRLVASRSGTQLLRALRRGPTTA
jgi:two-component system, LytTR family, response regulator